uniref:Uncharacterized protein n=1 Tax=Pararge aegeria TaxID=116150 RepID=S4P8L0_9NEOP
MVIILKMRMCDFWSILQSQCNRANECCNLWAGEWHRLKLFIPGTFSSYWVFMLLRFRIYAISEEIGLHYK